VRSDAAPSIRRDTWLCNIQRRSRHLPDASGRIRCRTRSRSFAQGSPRRSCPERRSGAFQPTVQAYNAALAVQPCDGRGVQGRRWRFPLSDLHGGRAMCASACTAFTQPQGRLPEEAGPTRVTCGVARRVAMLYAACHVYRPCGMLYVACRMRRRWRQCTVASRRSRAMTQMASCRASDRWSACAASHTDRRTHTRTQAHAHVLTHAHTRARAHTRSRTSSRTCTPDFARTCSRICTGHVPFLAVRRGGQRQRHSPTETQLGARLF
jgi:hypothetical protein